MGWRRREFRGRGTLFRLTSRKQNLSYAVWRFLNGTCLVGYLGGFTAWNINHKPQGFLFETGHFPK